MTFDEFERRAREMFDSIPGEYREGVDGLDVVRKTIPHPSLPDVFTMGECLSESYPSEFGGAGEILSRVVLYYGSFLELSRTTNEFDWDGELWETITHEIRHHLEHLATEEALEEIDYAEDQNFARREGERFDPFFYRSGSAIEGDAYEVDGDVFIEVPITRREFDRVRTLRVPWSDGELEVKRPDELGDVHFVRAGEVGKDRGGELFVVLVRRRGPAEWVAGLLKKESLRVMESTADGPAV